MRIIDILPADVGGDGRLRWPAHLVLEEGVHYMGEYGGFFPGYGWMYGVLGWVPIQISGRSQRCLEEANRRMRPIPFSALIPRPLNYAYCDCRDVATARGHLRVRFGK